MADPTHLNVLLVTSDSDTRRQLRAHLHNLDQACVVASRCSEAKALSAQTAFDAIVCDLTLPDGDALQLIESLGNNQPPWPFLSALASIKTSLKRPIAPASIRVWTSASLRKTTWHWRLQ